MASSSASETTDPRVAQFGRTAGKYFARWHWVLKLLSAMPQQRTLEVLPRGRNAAQV